MHQNTHTCTKTHTHAPKHTHMHQNTHTCTKTQIDTPHQVYCSIVNDFISFRFSCMIRLRSANGVSNLITLEQNAAHRTDVPLSAHLAQRRCWQCTTEALL